MSAPTRPLDLRGASGVSVRRLPFHVTLELHTVLVQAARPLGENTESHPGIVRSGRSQPMKRCRARALDDLLARPHVQVVRIRRAPSRSRRRATSLASAACDAGMLVEYVPPARAAWRAGRREARGPAPLHGWIVRSSPIPWLSVFSLRGVAPPGETVWSSRVTWTAARTLTPERATEIPSGRRADIAMAFDHVVARGSG